jgi:hypothetical protein
MHCTSTITVTTSFNRQQQQHRQAPVETPRQSVIPSSVSASSRFFGAPLNAAGSAPRSGSSGSRRSSSYYNHNNSGNNSSSISSTTSFGAAPFSTVSLTAATAVTAASSVDTDAVMASDDIDAGSTTDTSSTDGSEETFMMCDDDSELPLQQPQQQTIQLLPPRPVKLQGRTEAVAAATAAAVAAAGDSNSSGSNSSSSTAPALAAAGFGAFATPAHAARVLDSVRAFRL